MSFFPVLLLLVIIVVLVLHFGRKGKNATKEASPTASRKIRGVNSAAGGSRLPPIPSGFQIFSSRISVAGLQFRKDEVRKFIRSSQQTVEFEREPTNAADKNAIKVIGVGAGRKYFLGYVPAEVAEQIIGSGLEGVVQARLERAYESDQGFMDIIFQVIGPKVQKQQYMDFFKTKPAMADQKEFFKFCGLAVPRGLTIGDAEAQIASYKSRLESEDKSKLLEWEAYSEICDEIDDEDFGFNYGVKKISRTLLREALDALKAEGVSLKDVQDDIQVLVNKVIELKPTMERLDA